MQTFKTWLNTNPGMATTLTQELGVNATSISNAKTARRPIPIRWMPVIVALSKGHLSFESLINQNLKRQQDIGRA